MKIRYFLKQFIIYFLLISWFLFININNAVTGMSGQEVKSKVTFVYEAF
jgi:hypothetical protein